MWYTTKNGKRINTDWFDKDRQIAASKQEATERTTGIGGLHKQDAEATKGYTNSTLARRLNSALREGQKVDGENKEVMDRLDSNMENTTQDMTVYREVGIDSLVELMAKVKPRANTFEALQEALTGKSFTDKGFYSAYYEKTDNEYDDTILETRVRKGTPAILTSNEKEKEVILGRNGTYKILQVGRKDGKFHVIVERKG